MLSEVATMEASEYNTTVLAVTFNHKHKADEDIDRGLFDVRAEFPIVFRLLHACFAPPEIPWALWARTLKGAFPDLSVFRAISFRTVCALVRRLRGTDGLLLLVDESLRFLEHGFQAKDVRAMLLWDLYQLQDAGPYCVMFTAFSSQFFQDEARASRRSCITIRMTPLPDADVQAVLQARLAECKMIADALRTSSELPLEDIARLLTLMCTLPRAFSTLCASLQAWEDQCRRHEGGQRTIAALICQTAAQLPGGATYTLESLRPVLFGNTVSATAKVGFRSRVSSTELQFRDLITLGYYSLPQGADETDIVCTLLIPDIVLLGIALQAKDQKRADFPEDFADSLINLLTLPMRREGNVFEAFTERLDIVRSWFPPEPAQLIHPLHYYGHHMRSAVFLDNIQVHAQRLSNIINIYDLPPTPTQVMQSIRAGKMDYLWKPSSACEPAFDYLRPLLAADGEPCLLAFQNRFSACEDSVLVGTDMMENWLTFVARMLQFEWRPERVALVYLTRRRVPHYLTLKQAEGGIALYPKGWRWKNITVIGKDDGGIDSWLGTGMSLLLTRMQRLVIHQGPHQVFTSGRAFDKGRFKHDYRELALSHDFRRCDKCEDFGHFGKNCTDSSASKRSRKR
eukprot:m.203597 g.203597  ORF g.203597 m.203597 type:complete len:627 (+) comp10113_c0_seq4:510-2390(+)